MLMNKIDRYYETNSVIHKMNSFIKIICFLLFVIAIISNDLMVNILFIILLILLILFSKIPLSIYLEPILRVNWVLLILLIFNIIIGVSFYLNLIIIIKIILIIGYLLLINLTTSQSEIIYSLEILLTPLKIFKLPVNRIALFLSFCLRFIPMILNQYNEVLRSYKSRNSNFKISVYFKSIIMTFTKTFDKIKQIRKKMKLRLFDINKRRTNYRFNKIKIFDIIILFIHIILLILSFKGVM